MQTILGGGGAIGKLLAKELLGYTNQVRIFGRSPKKVNDSDEVMPGDLTNMHDVSKAVKGSEVVYLVAGLPYKLTVWQSQWPLVMQHVIEGCKQHKARLVFFDNIYMYDASAVPHLTENSAINPPSKKGKIRAAIAQQLLDETNAGRLTALIARAADFYGPGISTSVLNETVYKNLLKNKAAFWMGDKSKIHSYTYTPDAARATALLGNTPEAYNQVWHLPTSKEKWTGQQWVHAFATEMNKKEKIFGVSKGLTKIMGIFNPLMKEMVEMFYQNNQDYYFDSSKFMARFPDFKTTAYQDGVKEIVKAGIQ